MNDIKIKARDFFRKYKRAFSVVGILILFFVISIASEATYDSFKGGSAETYSDAGSSSCNVLGINLHGMLATYIPTQGSADDPEEYQAQYGDAVGSEDIVGSIWSANQDDSIKAILMEVDSSGGYPVAGEEIANALKESTKPTVVVIRQSGLSAAYWASTGATQIFASKNSDVGSIGVTSSYLDNVGKNQKDGNAYVQLSSGKYKDAGNPDKPLTEEERQLFLRDIKITHENFIEAVAANRHIPVDQVRALADGSSVLGEKAKELKLVDQIGGWTEAQNYIEEQIGEKPEICW
jgi:protease-4